MLRQLEVYETADGKRFDDQRKAQEHIADAIREVLDAKLAAVQQAGHLSAVDRYRIVMALIPDADAVKALHKTLAKWVDYD